MPGGKPRLALKKKEPKGDSVERKKKTQKNARAPIRRYGIKEDIVSRKERISQVGGRRKRDLGKKREANDSGRQACAKKKVKKLGGRSSGLGGLRQEGGGTLCMPGEKRNQAKGGKGTVGKGKRGGGAPAGTSGIKARQKNSLRGLEKSRGKNRLGWGGGADLKKKNLKVGGGSGHRRNLKDKDENLSRRRRTWGKK